MKTSLSTQNRITVESVSSCLHQGTSFNRLLHKSFHSRSRRHDVVASVTGQRRPNTDAPIVRLFLLRLSYKSNRNSNRQTFRLSELFEENNQTRKDRIHKNCCLPPCSLDKSHDMTRWQFFWRQNKLDSTAKPERSDAPKRNELLHSFNTGAPLTVCLTAIIISTHPRKTDNLDWSTPPEKAQSKTRTAVKKGFVVFLMNKGTRDQNDVIICLAEVIIPTHKSQSEVRHSMTKEMVVLRTVVTTRTHEDIAVWVIVFTAITIPTQPSNTNWTHWRHTARRAM